MLTGTLTFSNLIYPNLQLPCPGRAPSRNKTNIHSAPGPRAGATAEVGIVKFDRTAHHHPPTQLPSPGRARPAQIVRGPAKPGSESLRARARASESVVTST